MSRMRKRIDQGFEQLGRFVFRFRWPTLLVVGVVVAGLFTQVLNVRMQSNVEAFFHETDPELIAYDDFRAQFGRDDIVILAVTPEKIWDRDFLATLTEFHNALEDRLPYLDEVTSLVNVRDTRGIGDTLVVEDFLEEFPSEDAALAALQQRAEASRLYRNYLLSEDGNLTSIIIETVPFSPEAEDDDLLEAFDNPSEPSASEAGARGVVPLTDEETKELVQAVYTIAAEFNSDSFPIHIAGGPVVEVFFNEAMQGDMGKFTLASLVVIMVLLFALFRRIAGVLMPMIVVTLSVVSTIGLMGLTGTPFTIVTTFLPTFLLAVGVGHSVHLLAVFFRHYEQAGDKQGALVYAMGHSGLPIVMTGLTTAAGLFAFSRADIRMITELGIFGGTGILTGLVFTLVLLPALLAIWPMRAKVRLAPASWGQFIDRILTRIADFAVGRPWQIVIGAAVIGGISVAGMFSLNFSQNFIEWIPKSELVRQEVDLIDDRLKGGVNLEFVVDTGQENGLYEPAVMQAMDSLAPYSEQFLNYKDLQLIGKTFSVVDVLKETNQALNENQTEAYVIPENRELIAQELLLFENSGSDDLEDLVDSQFSKARFTFRARNEDAARYANVVAQIAEEAERVLGDSAEVVVTGRMALFASMIDTMMLDMVESYLIAAVVITLMMMLLIGSIRVGVLSMIVNFMPILVTLGFVMAIVTGIRLDVHNLTIGSIALGLAVDDTIHFFHNFRRYFAQTGNVREAVRQTLLTTGRAMLFTTIVLVTGFWMFIGATLGLNFNFGLLTGLAVIFALVSDFILAPALMELFMRTRQGAKIAKSWRTA